LKLLEKKFTHNEAVQLAKDKSWKLLTKQGLKNIDIEFLKQRIKDEGVLRVWVGNESKEVEKGVFLADLAIIEIVNNYININIVECNVLFLNRVIVEF
jgi:hypothetical protein